MRKFRLRGLERVNAEALFVAAGQNLKRLLAFRDREDPKKTRPASAALRPPGPMAYPSRLARRCRRRALTTGEFFNRLLPFCYSPAWYRLVSLGGSPGSRRADPGPACSVVPTEPCRPDSAGRRARRTQRNACVSYTPIRRIGGKRQPRAESTQSTPAAALHSIRP